MSAGVVSDDQDPALDRKVLPARLATAVIQAAVLYGLLQAANDKPDWPATVPTLFAPLLVASVLVPLLVMAGLGKVSWRPLGIWALCAGAAVAMMGWHDAARGRFQPFNHGPVYWPWDELWLAMVIGLFCAHALAIDRIAERSWTTAYARRFDTAWKQAVQLALSIAFVGLFWCVLLLGAELFHLIGINAFQELLEKRWFYLPATTLALAVAIHVTDVRPSLIRGARALILTLLSWLAPLLVLILLGFLCSLPFMSLKPLWKTHFAGGLLLTAAAGLILLINSCYQDGASELTPSRIKRLSVVVGALELTPIVLLAAWALILRVGQYGWSVERIFATALLIVAALYAAGYGVAVFWSATWMRRLETTNVVAAYVVIGFIVALFSPIADPGRWMVADQMGRLKSGTISAKAFDFWALKADGAGWGARALTQLGQLSQGRDADFIRGQAHKALASEFRFDMLANATADVLSKVPVYPRGRSLPADLFKTMAVPGLIATSCASSPNNCFARYLDFGPGAPETIVISSSTDSEVYQREPSGDWVNIGSLDWGMQCQAVREQLIAGAYSLSPHPQPDIVVAGMRMQISQAAADCPKPAPSQNSSSPPPGDSVSVTLVKP